MSLLQILFTAIALGCDAFSVALCIGSHKRYPGQRFRLGFHFGLFQALMFMIGYSVGWVVLGWVETINHWISSMIVGMVAVNMIRDSFRSHEEKRDIDFSRGWYLVSLSVATSLDALAIGFAFGLSTASPFLTSMIIGLVAGLMTLGGLRLGRRLRTSIDWIAELGAGIILLLIAVKLFQI